VGVSPLAELGLALGTEAGALEAAVGVATGTGGAPGGRGWDLAEGLAVVVAGCAEGVLAVLVVLG
jgi:hypothetical protein